MDKEFLEYLLKEIRSHKGVPYQMANEEYADEMFPYVKQIYPEAQMVKYDIEQYIVVTKRARTALIKLLRASQAKHENCIAEIERAVNELNGIITEPISDKIKEFFEEQERIQEESHKRTLGRHKEIMAEIEQVRKLEG